MDTFTTDATGTVTLPESLVPGTYYVRETSAKESLSCRRRDRGKHTRRHEPNARCNRLVL